MHNYNKQLQQVQQNRLKDYFAIINYLWLLAKEKVSHEFSSQNIIR